MKARDVLEDRARFAALSPAQRQIIRAVTRAGGGDLPVTSTDRGDSGFHGRRAAVDFGCPAADDRCRATLWHVARRLTATSWPGGVALGYPPADRHLHVDARPSPFYFVELSKSRPVKVTKLTGAWFDRLRPVYGVPAGTPLDSWLVGGLVFAVGVLVFALLASSRSAESYGVE